MYYSSPISRSPVTHADARSRRRFLYRLFFYAFALRWIVATLLNLTDAIGELRLSPDSERYDHVGETIAREMEGGDFNWPNWIDNGWFQFTGFVYFIFGPNPYLMQMVNALLGSLTPIVVYFVVLRAFKVERPARLTAILTAFFPSFVYWSCLMLKDPLSILAVSCTALSVLGLRDEFKLRWLVLMLASLVLLMGVRTYLVFALVFMILVSYVPVEQRHLAAHPVRMLALAGFLGTVLYAAGYGFLGTDFIANSFYFDLDYINATRVNISHGGGAFFHEDETPLWGEDLSSTLQAAGAAIFFFFVTLDLTDVGGTRQLMALPEVLLILLLMPSFFRGLLYCWRRYRQAALPLMIFAFGLLAVYGSATTNMGAMYRWRMQAMPFIMTFMVIGVLVHGRGVFYRLLTRIRL